MGQHHARPPSLRAATATPRAAQASYTSAATLIAQSRLSPADRRDLIASADLRSPLPPVIRARVARINPMPQAERLREAVDARKKPAHDDDGGSSGRFVRDTAPQ
jgi:hypothetical protein